ncbi:MAG: hypothetical protein NUV47_01370 [Patescibacteria group bacterium]|nr:hypothetical protein [Patescibacteria group bacterium]
MDNKKTLLISAVVVLIIVGFVLFAKKTPTFTSPIYETGESPDVLSSPLFLVSNEKDEKQKIAEFKSKVLRRISLNKPLSNQEKSVLEVSISVSDKSTVGQLIMANQNILNFTPDELARINIVLKK